jgi:hypothetical protein
MCDAVIERIAAGLEIREAVCPSGFRRERVMFNADKAKEGLRRWLHEELGKSVQPYMEGESLRDLWEHIGSEYGPYYGRLADISRVALFVLSIPASSAAAERHIWRQRRVLCPDRARTSLRTEENRTRIAACACVPGFAGLSWE